MTGLLVRAEAVSGYGSRPAINLVIEMPSPDVALMREEQIAPQRMQTLALVS
jgi:hypothetical protein